MLPRATWPKLTDAGATEMAAAPGVFGWLEAGLVAPVSPMQPELLRIAKRRRTRAAKGIAFLPTELASVAHFSAPRNHFIHLFFIAAIVVCGEQCGLLSLRTLKGQVR